MISVDLGTLTSMPPDGSCEKKTAYFGNLPSGYCSGRRKIDDKHDEHVTNADFQFAHRQVKERRLGNEKKLQIKSMSTLD